MLKTKKLFLVILLIFSVIIISHLSKTLANEQPEITVVLKDMNSQYWEILSTGVKKGYQDFDLEGKILHPPKATVEEQIKLLETVLEEKPDVLVVSPSDPERIIPTLEKFVDQNIPVILLDTNYAWKQKTAYVGTDNLELGRKAGELVGAQLQPGDKVALIGGDPRIPVVGERLEGAKEALIAAGITIAEQKIGIIEGTKNTNIEIEVSVEAIIKKHPDLKGIIGANDGMALTALNVAERHGLHIPITGADGIIEMLEVIEEERIPGTVAQNPYDMGYLSIDTALKVAKGEKVEKNVDSGVDIIIKGNAEERLVFLRKLLN